MVILNLVYPDKSDIKYNISRFPDGQQQVTIKHEYITKLVPRQFSECTIKSRLNNFKDLELIICATKSLRNVGYNEIHLYVPYFLGSRSDRQFEEGGNSYLKDVICPIINSLGFESVTVLDPHSHVLEACLNNFRKDYNLGLVKFSLNDLHNKNEKGYTQQELLDNIILVSPDAGASHKIYKLAEQIGYKGDIITCSKERDINGKLTKTVVPDFDLSKDIIIIDDICDGGRTFVNIAQAVDDKNEYEEVSRKYLIVTHGIFSKGTTELGQYFDAIYCTNSYKDCNQLELIKVKQLNVF